MKNCNTCHTLKPLDDFPKNKCMADGRLNKCKLCFSIYKKQYWIENKEKLKEYKKIHRSENKEHYQLYSKSYRQNNLDKLKLNQKINREKNKGKVSAYNSEYAKSENGKQIRKKIQEKYLSTEKGKILVKRSTEKYIEKNPIKIKCHSAVRRAKKSGLIIQPSNCENCSIQKQRIHAHHDDYSKLS